MKKIVLLSLMFVFITSLFAQKYQEVDPKAKEILDKLSVKTKAFTSMQADFTFTLENKQEKIKDVQKGKIWIKGNKYKVDMNKATSFYDGKTMYSYIKDANEATITQPDPNDDNTLNPAKIFTIYEKGYKIRFISDKFEDNRTLYEIDLYPIDLKKEFSRITLKIDKTKNELYSLSRYGKDGNVYVIVISNLLSNQVISDATFVFDKTKYPKVEVIDMRD